MLPLQILALDLNKSLEQAFVLSDDANTHSLLAGLNVDDVLMFGMAMRGIDRIAPLAEQLDYVRTTGDILEDLATEYKETIGSLCAALEKGELLSDAEKERFKALSKKAYEYFEATLDVLSNTVHHHRNGE